MTAEGRRQGHKGLGSSGLWYCVLLCAYYTSVMRQVAWVVSCCYHAHASLLRSWCPDAPGCPGPSGSSFLRLTDSIEANRDLARPDHTAIPPITMHAELTISLYATIHPSLAAITLLVHAVIHIVSKQVVTDIFSSV